MALTPHLSNPLKYKIGEEAEYDKVIARYKTEGWGASDKEGWAQNMRIVPVNFNKEHKAMLGNCKMILEVTSSLSFWLSWLLSYFAKLILDQMSQYHT